MTTSSVRDPMIGRELGDYTITGLIAKGGMGRVYAAKDNQIDRQIAIKVIKLDEEIADEMMERFQREARVIGQLDGHPNIITIYRYGKEDDLYYIAMKYIAGDSLAEYMKKLGARGESISPEELLHILRQVAAALDYAHQHEIIHRDVKPANVMLEHDPSQPEGMRRAILMDFGLVMRVNNTITTGSAFGTPRYISPEQAISSAQANPQSDIYSFGVMTYEILAGQPPFEDEETPIAVALSHVTKPPPDPRLLRPDVVTDAVAAVLMKVLEKKPENRYQKASEFVNDLADALAKKQPRGLVLADRPITKALAPTDFMSASDSEPVQGEIADQNATRSSRRLWLVLGAVLVLLVLGVLLSGVLGDGGQSSDGDAPIEPPPAGASYGALALALPEDGPTLSIVNPNDYPMRLQNLEFRRGETRFSLADLGQTLLDEVPANSCVYITTLAASQDEDFTLPDDCEARVARFAGYYINTSGFVWLGDTPFEVYQDDRLVGRCVANDTPCTIENITQAN